MQPRTWSGLVVRAGTPRETVEHLSREVAAVMAMPEVREILAKQQDEIPTGTAEQFREPIRRGVVFGLNVVRANGIEVD